LGIPVIFTEQYPEGLGKTVSEVNIGPGAVTFEKTTFSACTEEVISELNRLGRKKIIITAFGAANPFFCCLKVFTEFYFFATCTITVFPFLNSCKIAF
jgi:hypothetical protein